MSTTTTTISKKLSLMPYAQAHVVIDQNGTHLISYVTHVATIDNDGWLSVRGLYSMTTRKHISAFLKEYSPCPVEFSTVKQLVKDKMSINLYTGEVYQNMILREGPIGPSDFCLQIYICKAGLPALAGAGRVFNKQMHTQILIFTYADVYDNRHSRKLYKNLYEILYTLSIDFLNPF